MEWDKAHKYMYKDKRVTLSGYNKQEVNVGDKLRVVKDCYCEYSLHIFKPISVPAGTEIICTDISERFFGHHIHAVLEGGVHIELNSEKLELIKNV